MWKNLQKVAGWLRPWHFWHFTPLALSGYAPGNGGCYLSLMQVANEEMGMQFGGPEGYDSRG